MTEQAAYERKLPKWKFGTDKASRGKRTAWSIIEQALELSDLDGFIREYYADDKREVHPDDFALLLADKFRQVMFEIRKEIEAELEQRKGK